MRCMIAALRPNACVRKRTISHLNRFSGTKSTAWGCLPIVIVCVLFLGRVTQVLAGADEDKALLEAVRTNNKEGVMRAIQLGSNINAESDYKEKINGLSAIEDRERQKQPFDQGQYEQEEKEFWYWVSIDHVTPLMLAAKNGNLEIAKILINHNANVNAINRNGARQGGQTILMYAAGAGNLGLVRLLVSKRADLTAYATWKYDETTNALTEACPTGNKQLIQYLTDNGLKPNDPRICARCLSGAVQSGNQEAIQFLLARSTGTECLGDALVESIRKKNKSLTDVLLSRGAPVNHIENNNHGTACVEATPLSSAIESRDENLVELLVSKGANPNLPDCGDAGDPSAFKIAVGQGDKHLVALLLSHGADAKGVLPWADDVDMAESLLSHGADINYALKGDFTALMSAARAGEKTLVEYLIAHGADVNWKMDREAWFPADWKPPTALSEAQENHHDDIAAILKRAGAKE